MGKPRKPAAKKPAAKKPAAKKPAAKKPAAKKPAAKKPVKKSAKPAAKKHRPTKAPRPSNAKHRALERMADIAGAPMRVESAAPTRFALWQLRATFYMPSGTTYDHVAEILDAWESDKSIRRDIGRKSTARIQVAYDHGRGRSGEYTLAEIGTFDFALSRAIERVDVRDGDDDSLVARYGIDGNTSTITRIYLWLGADASLMSGFVDED